MAADMTLDARRAFLTEGTRRCTSEEHRLSM